jgi:hypothetical protein
MEALLDLHANGPVPRLDPSFSRLQPILDRLMAKDRDQRYADAQTLLNDLARLGVSI